MACSRAAKGKNRAPILVTGVVISNVKYALIVPESGQISMILLLLLGSMILLLLVTTIQLAPFVYLWLAREPPMVKIGKCIYYHIPVGIW